MSWCHKRYFWRLCPFSIDRKGQHFTLSFALNVPISVPSLPSEDVSEQGNSWEGLGLQPSSPHTLEGVSGEGSTPALKPFLGRRPRTISVQNVPSLTPGVCFSRQQVVNHSRSLWLLWKVVLSYQGPRQSSFVIQKWMEEACSHILGAETSLEAKRPSLPLPSAVPVLLLTGTLWSTLEKLKHCCFIPGDFSTLSSIARPQLSCTPERGNHGDLWPRCGGSQCPTAEAHLPATADWVLSSQNVASEFAHSSNIGSLWDPYHQFSQPRLVKSKSHMDWKDHHPPFHPGWARPKEVKGPEQSNTLS